MKRVCWLAGLAILVLTSCHPFKKAKEGALYRIISDGKGKKLEYGNFFEANYIESYEDSRIDSILASSYKTHQTQLGVLDTVNMHRGDQYEIFSQLRNGDSLIVKIPADTLVKKGINMEGLLKKGGFLIIRYKIINVFEKREQVDSAVNAQRKAQAEKDSIAAAAQIIKDDQVIEAYLAKNNIKAVKAPQGTYVQVIDSGTGDRIDTSKVPKVAYSGMLMATGKVFDSNTDSSFHHTELYPVDMKPEERSTIIGWQDGLSLLRKGAKAKFYIPSPLGYGEQGSRGVIPPNAILIFDIDVKDMITFKDAVAEQQKKMKENQHRQDSMMNARKIAPVKKP